MNRYNLVGATSSHELIFADFEINSLNGCFSASFSVVRPFIETDVRIYDTVEECIATMDENEKWDIVCRYDCRPSELADYLLEDYGIQEIMDCSLFPETIFVHGFDWYFESDACGQIDPREYDIVHWACNKELFDTLLWLWDNYHLQELPGGQTNIDAITAGFLEYEDMMRWIKEYIHESL